jgi:hypothetical protein
VLEGLPRRANVELVIGFLDAIRRRDRDAASGFLAPGIVWRGLEPDQFCAGPPEVVEGFVGQRDREIEVDRLELHGTERGAVFAFHLPGSPGEPAEELPGPVYHALSVDGGRVTAIEDHRTLGKAISSLYGTGPLPQPARG